ncbi:DUF4396 domain-containing protein [Bacteroides cellulosilyticus]|uniref:DUF4396 domain-containing protein n=1 Tax=Bacteroides cellulosilyticus TaxID=246787 RepID=UPI00356A3A9B
MLTTTSLFFVCSGFAIALIIANNLTHNKQSMKIMNVVWVLTALWASYLALWAYFRFGKENKQKEKSMDMASDMKMDTDMEKNMDMQDMKMQDMPMDMPMTMPMGHNNRPHWQSIALSALHCGAGCTLADIIGEWFTYYFPISIGGSMIIGNWIFDFILALLIGVYFQFYAIREMEHITVSAGLTRAFKADFFSLLSWQIGMYGWMAIVYFLIFKDIPLPKNTWTFWFMMQIAMLVGFVCAYPMNALLIKLGVKKGM